MPTCTLQLSNNLKLFFNDSVFQNFNQAVIFRGNALIDVIERILVQILAELPSVLRDYLSFLQSVLADNVLKKNTILS